MRELPSPFMPLSDLKTPPAPWGSLHLRSQHRLGELAETKADTTAFEVSWARTEDDIRQAQALRYQVFAVEMGARMTAYARPREALDIDLFDPYCEHLLVRAQTECDTPGTGPVIGTYGALTPAAAALKDGGAWPLLRSRRLALRWRDHGVVGRAGRIHDAQRLGHHGGLRQREHAGRWSRGKAPALIKGYLRCSAKALGPPAWDPDFNSADLPLLMRIGDLPTRYRKHFLGN